MDQNPPQQNASSTSNDEYEKLLSEAHNEDIADELGEPSAESEVSEAPGDRAPEAGVQQNQPTDNPEPSAEPKRGPDGKFLPKDAAPVEKPTEQQVPESPTESKYAKAKKDQERYDRNWQKLNERSEALAKRAEEIERAAARMAQQAQQPIAQQNNGLPSIPSKEWERAAEIFGDEADQLTRDGDTEGALAKRKLAKDCVQTAQRLQQDELRGQQTQWDQQWNADANQFIKENAEFSDMTSEHAKQMQAIYGNPELQWLKQVKNGFAFAGKAIQDSIKAAEASGLREENSRYKAEIERLTKLTTPAGGKDPAKHSAPQSADNMPLQDLHRKLEREAELEAAYQ